MSIALVTEGPRHDGSYFERIWAETEAFADPLGYGVIVFDAVAPTDARAALTQIAQTAEVDAIFLASNAVAGSLEELSQRFPQVYWYCNCGPDYPASPNYSLTADNQLDIHYTGGVALGLKLQESGGDEVGMLGCCEMDFEQKVFLALELGLKTVNQDYSVRYFPTGDAMFDFHNIPNASQALDLAVEEGLDAIYPFLAGAVDYVVRDSRSRSFIVAYPGDASSCDSLDDDGENLVDVAIRFDGSDYFVDAMQDILAGRFSEGTQRTFSAASHPSIVGAEFCNSSSSLEDRLDRAFEMVRLGSLNDEFDAIREAVSGDSVTDN